LSSSEEKRGTVTIGKVVGVHGLTGTCKVHPYADSLTVFDSGCEIIVLSSNEATMRAFKVEWSKPHNRLVLLSLKGINDRDQAEKLIGSKIVTDRISLPELDPGTYYWHDLIGMSVYTNEGVFLGRLETVIPTGSNDVYVVKQPESETNDEILVPALTSVVLEIDLENHRMHVDLPEGL